MSRSTVAIILLAAALLGTNAWWVYQAIDVAVTGEYQAVAYREHREALTQTLAILPVVASSDATRERIVAAALGAIHTTEPFEKEGYVWAGRLGLRFNEQGRLTEVVPAWSPY